MRLAISNIAWDVGDDEAVSSLLNWYGVDAIDIAPGKYFPRIAEASESSVLKVKHWWAERGIEITGMQALLFGTQGMNVFGPAESKLLMLKHLAAVCRVGRILGATRLVFGSPKNRDRALLDEKQARSEAMQFFRKWGDIAATEGVTVCLEPNPVCYGANFMTTSLETLEIVRSVNHPSIRMQIDSGAMTINGEQPREILAQSAAFVGHVHASEPDLAVLGDGATDHHAVRDALDAYLPHALVSIEMLTRGRDTPLYSIARALEVANHNYRSVRHD